MITAPTALATVAEPPTLDAYRDGLHTVVWCEHEGRWHRHGAHGCGQPETCLCELHGVGLPVAGDVCTCPIGSGNGHRGAHCQCRRMFAGPGYVLREVGYLTDEIRRRHQELSVTRGCAWDSCRFDRLAARQRQRGAASREAAVGKLAEWLRRQPGDPPGHPDGRLDALKWAMQRAVSEHQAQRRELAPLIFAAGLSPNTEAVIYLQVCEGLSIDQAGAQAEEAVALAAALAAHLGVA
jgi:hypothetical protein